jgi:hypothetical protein
MIRAGYGNHSVDIPRENYPDVYNIGTWVQLMSMIACVACKTSFALTLLRLATGWMRWSIIFVIVTMNIFMITAAFLLTFRCNPIQGDWDYTIKATCLAAAPIYSYSSFAPSMLPCTYLMLLLTLTSWCSLRWYL